MKAVLSAELGEQYVVTLTLTRQELDDAAGSPEVLLEVLREACRLREVCEPEENCGQQPAVEENPSETEASEASEKAGKEEAESAAGPFVIQGYKDISVSDLSGTREEVIERILSALIENNDIPVSMEKVESETEYILLGNLQKIRYDTMLGNAPADAMQTVDPDELKEEIRRDIIREQKEKAILKSIIEQEHFTATPEELLEEAKAMAERQGTTLEMVKTFFGEDFHGITGELLLNKARNFLYDLAEGVK